VTTASTVDARKQTLQEKDALELAGTVDEIFAMKGKKVVHLDLKTEKVNPDTLKALLLGPTGNLRAPTMRKGRTLLVGFDEATYKKVLG
jgi:arsenate reductase-like glutaredoxin family protein